jgi:1,4-dihydroxy-2-naphthoate octaprenyltransferase
LTTETIKKPTNRPLGNKQKASIYIKAIRPKTLFASVGPVLLGLAFTYYQSQGLDLLLGFSTLMCALFLQMSTNLVNDYYDYVRGIDDEKRLGPQRVTQAGLLTPFEIKVAFAITFIIALLFALHVFIAGGFVLFILGLLCFVTAFAYTGGPIPLSYYGLGEIMAFIFFGPVVTWGIHYSQTHQASALAFVVGMGPGFISACIMSINNLRDIHSDQQKSKTTLATISGEKTARMYPLALVLLSLVIPFYLGVTIGDLFHLTFFIPIFFLKSWDRLIREPISKEFNKSLTSAGIYIFLYSIYLALCFLFYAGHTY